MNETEFLDYENMSLPSDSYPYDDTLVPNWCQMDDLYSFSTMFTSILYSLIFLLSLLGNSLVLWILVKYENLTSLTNLFIVNLCITDLAFSCTLPFWIAYYYYGWILGDFLCKVVSATFSVSYYGGVIFLTIMTIFRYLSVVDPLSTLRSQTKKRSVLVSLAIWSISVLVTVPEIIFTQVVTNKGKLQCEYINTTWKFVELCQQFVFFLCSFSTIAICYIRMIKILLGSRSQKRYRTVRLIFAIVLVFFLSWAPYNVLGFLDFLSYMLIIKLSCDSTKQVVFAFDISRKIAFCHCCLNPVLYVFVGVKFRRHLKLLCKKYCSYHSRIEPSSPRAHSFHTGPYEDGSMY
ncbi:PREDICTED: chemokine XC receptor 1 [Gekko japonicus]|uniref:Chemokine XC receptor 1 n=1 Tax=Gekko japonicus TaxID=146911 RepID=A0ABM1K1W9_GEKJA|nr:PREDICTED: chemokine XC receptor 1 [Gekko japonicus]